MAERAKVPIGGSRVNPSDLKGLRWAWAERRLALFLGAGASLAYGVPTWKDLVVELLFEQSAAAARLRGFQPAERRALAAWLAEYFGYDPVVLARVVKNEIGKRARRAGASAEEAEARFLESVRRRLWVDRRAPAGPTTLTAVADLLERGVREGRIPGVVTFNFDDLLEQELARRGVEHAPVWNARRFARRGLPVFHPHGFLPEAGEVPADQDLVFSEDEYHDLTGSIFHWAATEITSLLRHATVLFLGLSMSDPNLRRLLDASYTSGDIPQHWHVQRRHRVPDGERKAVLREIARRAAKARTLLGGTAEDPERLSAAMDAVLRQADSYDQRLFESMGVKTIWIESHADTPALLAAIME